MSKRFAKGKRKAPSVVRLVELFEAVPLSLRRTVSGALRARDSVKLKAIKEHFGSPQMYKDPGTYLKYATFLALFSKSQIYEDREAEFTAFQTFKDSCSRMTYVNKCIESVNLTPITLKVLNRAGAFIEQHYRHECIDQFFMETMRNARHGPGSTVEVKGKQVHGYYKCTAPARTGNVAAVHAFIHDQSRYRGMAENVALQYNTHNAGTFVPKTLWTRRMIAIEPLLNMYYQQGVGRILKRQLLTTGVDLAHGQRSNRLLAREASIGGHFATIDISAASDSIAYSLVSYLFRDTSPALFSVLNSLRSAVMDLQVGRETTSVVLPMFSTMGNGYTFPLETIVFQSLIEGVRSVIGDESPYLVYGDDLIVHVDLYAMLTNVLSELGMVPNVAKSYATGHFRESCGSDWFDGLNVRPPFLKTLDYNSLLAFRNLSTLNPYLDSVVEYLDGFITHFGPKKLRRCTDGSSDNYVIGVDSYELPGWAWSDDYPTRYDKDLQCLTVRESIATTTGYRGEEHLDFLKYETLRTGTPERGPLEINDRMSSSRKTRWVPLHG